MRNEDAEQQNVRLRDSPARLSCATAWVHAQNTTNFATPVPRSAPTGPAPRTPDGKPDFTGVWQRAYVPDMSRNGRGQQGYAEAPFAPGDTPARREELRKAGNYAELPFTAAGLQDWRTYDPANGEYTASCLPFGLSRSMNSPDPMQVMQNDKYIALLFEQNTWFNVIYLDGRPHPRNLEPTWFGHSIGKWDGDTLVVDTVGFNGWTRLDTVGHPHSDALHMVQTLRMHRRRPHRLHGDDRRSEGVYEAVQERADVHADGHRADRVFVRGEQPGPAGRPHQAVDAAGEISVTSSVRLQAVTSG